MQNIASIINDKVQRRYSEGNIRWAEDELISMIEDNLNELKAGIKKMGRNRLFGHIIIEDMMKQATISDEKLINLKKNINERRKSRNS